MSAVAMLGGRDLPDEVVRVWSATATDLYAADSGADRLLALGFRPTVVGDMDSFKGSREGLRVVQSADQETSDLDKLLDVVRGDGHSRLVVLGIEGDRLDHVLVGLHRLAASPVAVLVVLRRGLGFVAKGDAPFTWGEDTGHRFSVVNMGCRPVTIKGARWPVGPDASFKSSISNVIDPGPLVVEAEGAALVIVERDPAALVPW